MSTPFNKGGILNEGNFIKGDSWKFWQSATGAKLASLEIYKTYISIQKPCHTYNCSYIDK